MAPEQVTALLTGCKSWEGIQRNIQALPPRTRQIAFAELMRLRLRTMSEYQSQLRHIWLVKNAPTHIANRVGNAMPTSLVAETQGGTLWIIDCIYRASNQRMSHQDTTNALSPANKAVAFHLLCATADRPETGIPHKVGFLGPELWENTTEETIREMRSVAKNAAWKPQPATRRPLQKETVELGIAYFNQPRKTRGKVIQPCGSGKSLIGYWIHQDLGSNRTIITVPSLSLLKQTLQVWLKENLANGIHTDWACICSDNSVGRNENSSIKTQDLGIPCLTQPAEIAKWLAARKQQPVIVFCTYQSGQALAAACQQAKFHFDFGIHDEAHKTAGRLGKPFAHLIHNKNLKIRRRLFMTATERQYSGPNEDALSMENPKIYGDTIHCISFKEAVRRKIICDHRILTVEVKKSEIREMIQKNALVFPDHDHWEQSVKARHFAALIALHKAMDKYPIRHAVSFHNSIQFAEIFKKHNEDYCKIRRKKMECFHVSGKTPNGVRAHTLHQFEQSKHGLITNAKCLVEGIDIPNIDAVVFVDGKKNKIDIVQSTGRALRPFPGKQYGYIILPVIFDDEGPEESCGFDDIIGTLRALGNIDSRIIEYFHRINEKQPGEKERHLWEETDIHIPVGFEEFHKAVKIRELGLAMPHHWKSFEEAREFARASGIQNYTEWQTKKANMPPGIPKNPDEVYHTQGWINWPDWLGRKPKGRWKKKWKTFEQARAFARKSGVKSESEWRKFTKTAEMPDDMPIAPHTFYLNKGWNGWRDWFGNPINGTAKIWRSFKQAHNFAKKSGIDSAQKWRAARKAGALPIDVPTTPEKVYANKGWTNWQNWFNKKPMESTKGHANPPQKTWMSFEDAKKFVKSQGITAREGWRQFLKSGEVPGNLPRAPYMVYAKDWTTWQEFFGVPKKWRSFEDARKFARNSGIESSTEWFKMKNRPKDIPRCADKVYRNNGWKGWKNWCDTPTKNNSRNSNWRTFEQARGFVRSLGLNKRADWYEFIKSGNLPQNIPRAPNDVYPKEWAGWTDFLIQP